MSGLPPERSIGGHPSRSEAPTADLILTKAD